VGELPWDNLEIRVYPGADATFSLYEDEGDNYNYERGQYTEITFRWNDRTRQLSIAPRKGKFEGMLQNRRFNIVLPGQTSGKIVEYAGQEVTVKL
jgi:alpha-D-xyloside xylohydrolase